jgi:hypothetical protein
MRTTEVTVGGKLRTTRLHLVNQLPLAKIRLASVRFARLLREFVDGGERGDGSGFI